MSTVTKARQDEIRRQGIDAAILWLRWAALDHKCRRMMGQRVATRIMLDSIRDQAAVEGIELVTP